MTVPQGITRSDVDGVPQRITVCAACIESSSLMCFNLHFLYTSLCSQRPTLETVVSWIDLETVCLLVGMVKNLFLV